jgi:hypothetical protein
MGDIRRVLKTTNITFSSNNSQEIIIHYISQHLQCNFPPSINNHPNPHSSNNEIVGNTVHLMIVGLRRFQFSFPDLASGHSAIFP